MSNPIFNEQSMRRDAAGWAAPVRGTHVTPMPFDGAGFPPPGTASTGISDGPVSNWQKAMTVEGTVTASLVLLVLMLISGAFGWAAAGTTLTDGTEAYQFPPMAFVGIIIGFVAVIALHFKPMWARVLGPVYAIAYGFAVGAISKGYETFQDGIVLQAAGATVAVFAVMLVMYRTGIIRVTDKFRRIVVGATLGIMVLYGVSIIVSLFGGDIAFINSPSLLGIGFSVFVCALAAANLALDFDLIDKGTKAGMPKAYEWVAAMGLVVTIVWLYLELLRLLSKLQQR